MPILALLGVALSSGFTGIYVELLMKASTTTMWERNFQLAAWSLLGAGFMYMQRESDGAQHFESPLSFWALATATTIAAGGILVGLVAKKAGMVAKGFANGIAVCLTTVISLSFFGTHGKSLVKVTGGITLVTCATMWYILEKSGKGEGYRRSIVDKAYAIMPPAAVASLNRVQAVYRQRFAKEQWPVGKDKDSLPDTPPGSLARLTVDTSGARWSPKSAKGNAKRLHTTIFRCLMVSAVLFFILLGVVAVAGAMIFTPVMYPAPKRLEASTVVVNNNKQFTVRGNKKPGSGWAVPALPPDVPRASTVKKVAIITEACLPKIDGVAKTTYLVTQHHINEGRDVMLICPANDLYGYRENDPALYPQPSPGARGDPETGRFGTLTVVGQTSFIPPNFPPESRLSVPVYTIPELEEFMPDLLHLFSPALSCWSGLGFHHRHPEVPVIANFQTDIEGMSAEFNYGMISFSELIWSNMRGLHSMATITLTPSHFMQRRLREHGFVDQRLWVRGVDHEKFNPSHFSAETRQMMLRGSDGEYELSADGEEPLLCLYVGRLSNEKHVEYLIDVAKLDGVQLVVVGDGPTRLELEELFSGTDTLFLGMVIGEELNKIYASADVFTFTGTAETAGNVVREAMSAGLPSLLVNSGGIVDTVLDGYDGYLVEPDAYSFARAVEMLRDDRPHLAQLKRQTIEFSHLIPTWGDVMKKLEGYYIEAVELQAQRMNALLQF